MGNDCGESSIRQIAKETIEGSVHHLIHYGDTAYNMDENCGVKGDDFLNDAMSYSTVVPIIYTNGNHEGGNLKLYKEYVYHLAHAQNELAEASGSNNNRYFKWRFGPVTYIIIDPGKAATYCIASSSINI